MAVTGTDEATNIGAGDVELSETCDDIERPEATITGSEVAATVDSGGVRLGTRVICEG